MNWYQEWFNSENYLKVYRHRDETEAEKLVELIISNVKLKEHSSVLDMACGAGRHAIEFAKRGFDVTAVDLSGTLISEAKKNADYLGVSINFVLSDILEFRPDKKFDLALNLFTSIGYFEDDEENYEVIRKAYDTLNEEGYFVLDYFNQNYLIKNLVPTSVFSENGSRIIQNRSIKENRVVKKITIEKKNSNEEFYESVRLFSHEELVQMMNRAGFKIIKEFGDYFGGKYDEENSPRLIVIARK